MSRSGWARERAVSRCTYSSLRVCDSAFPTLALVGWRSVFRSDPTARIRSGDTVHHPRGARRIMQLFRRAQGSKRMEPASAHPRRSWLSANDEEMLAKQLVKIRKPVSNAFTAGSASTRFILTVPPEQIQERLFQVISVYNLIHALILSGLIGNALNPLDPTSFAEDKENLVHAFNIVVSLVLVLSAFSVCTTTWALANVVSLTTETAFRFALHSDSFWVQEMLSWAETMLLTVAMCLAVWIRNSTVISAIISGLAFVVSYVVCHVHHKWILQACAHTGWSYANGIRDNKPSSTERSEAERIGGMLARDVEQRREDEIAAVASTEDISAAATAADAVHAEALASLVSLVEQAQVMTSQHGGKAKGSSGSRALPESSGREAQIALKLLRAGLEVPVLRAAAAEGVDVCVALRDVPGLTTGERLSIAIAVRRLGLAA